MINKLTSEQKKLSDKLTTLQQQFVTNLVSKSMSQREAYIAAGGKAKTESAQDTSASEIMRKLQVKAFYDSLMHSAASGAVLTKQRSLEILTASAEVSITDVCDLVEGENGKHVWKVKDLSTIPRDIVKCIKSITLGKGEPKLELYDSHGAIKQISDMLGHNVPRKTQISGPDDAPVEHKMTVTFIDAVTKDNSDGQANLPISSQEHS